MKNGFTLAEVLLTLAVIGIVAAITLPSLLVDTTEKAFDAQKRALHARLAQAIGMMSTLSGYGQYVEEVKNEDGSIKTEGKDDAAETFLYEGLSKVYKMNNICDSDNLVKCGIPNSITTMAGTTIDFPKKLSELNNQLINDPSETEWGTDLDKQTTDTKVAAFETVNGESVAVFYNPNCKNNQASGTPGNTDEYGEWFYTQNRMCVNFIYDLNGTKGPNKVGRDIGFITALYAKNSEVVAPVPVDEHDFTKQYAWQDAIDLCINQSDDSRLPNIHELTAMFYNQIIIGNMGGAGMWSSSTISANKAWGQDFTSGGRRIRMRNDELYVRCVKK